jgi:hypothetical protein
MSDLLFDDDEFEEAPDASLAWSRKLVVAEPFATRALGDTGPDDLQRAEMQFRMSPDKTPVLFDDNEPGMWGPRAEFAKLMGVPVESLTLEAAEEWLIEQHASK